MKILIEHLNFLKRSTEHNNGFNYFFISQEKIFFSFVFVQIHILFSDSFLRQMRHCASDKTKKVC